jgi:4'-phosphopantetheinyl transferase EntD
MRSVPSIETNPARLSIRLSELFPHGALTAELQGAGDPRALYPEEAKHLGKAVRKRVEEFAAGRLCARLLLGEFGTDNFAIEVGPGRQPLWPPALVGSITHTTGFCAAVVAPRMSLRSVGIDTEIAGGVKPELWRGICTPEESAWLRSLSSVEQIAAATVIFSAKEAFYKCQFPLTQQYLGFHDVSVELPEWDQRRGSFTVRANRRIDLDTKAAWPLQGLYLFHEQFITSGIALPEALF